jgi:predicted NBD/HSP70 family sugar kinase
VLSAVISAGELERPRLAAVTGLSQPTISRAVESLIDEGILVEGERAERSGPGRTPTRVRLNAKLATIVGVDLGGTNCRIVLADAMGRTLGRSRHITPSKLSSAELADWLAGHIFELAVRHGGGADLGAVAIGLPGAVAGDKERVVGSVNLPQIIGSDFINSLAEATGVPTVVDNDSNLALRGELQYGFGTVNETTALLVLGTGLSAAISLDGEVLSGREGMLGEFGRLPLPGGADRIRDLLSGAGLVAYSARNGHDVRTAQELFASPQQHRAILDEVDKALLHLITVIALAYEPQSILLTGGFSDSFDKAHLARVAAEVEEQVGVHASVRHSSLGDSAGLLGAMSLALASLYLNLGVTSDDVATVRSGGRDAVRLFEACDPGKHPAPSAQRQRLAR